jgi:hypothetical protein
VGHHSRPTTKAFLAFLGDQDTVGAYNPSLILAKACCNNIGV